MTPGRLAAFLALCALLGALFATACYVGFTADRTVDCAPVDYVHGAWLNEAGEQVAVAPEEDSVLHYVGACS